VLAAGAVAPLLANLNHGAKLSFVRNATWTLSNFLRGRPPPDFSAIEPCLPMLATLIHSEDVDVLTDGMWALSYLTDTDDEVHAQAALEVRPRSKERGGGGGAGRSRSPFAGRRPWRQLRAVVPRARAQPPPFLSRPALAIAQAGVAQRVSQLLLHTSAAVVTPALRTAGNIVTGDDVQTQVMINAGCLEGFVHLIKRGKRGLRKEACWAISNIMAGSHEQIQVRRRAPCPSRRIHLTVSPTPLPFLPPRVGCAQMVLDLHGVTALVEAILHTDIHDVRREACWAISNATSGCSSLQVIQLLNCSVIEALSSEGPRSA
jgi:importin subunit alpha-6/7